MHLQGSRTLSPDARHRTQDDYSASLIALTHPRAGAFACYGPDNSFSQLLSVGKDAMLPDGCTGEQEAVHRCTAFSTHTDIHICTACPHNPIALRWLLPHCMAAIAWLCGSLQRSCAASQKTASSIPSRMCCCMSVFWFICSFLLHRPSEPLCL